MTASRSTFLSRLLDVGVDPRDDEETRLRKLLLLVAALTITPLAVGWGAVYYVAGATGPALVPWAYVALSMISLVAFGLTRSYRWFAIGQFVPYMTLPFGLMWALGGFVPGSAVALWAALAPLTALLLGHRAAALLLAGAYSALIVVSAIAPMPAGPDLSDSVHQGLFVLNLTGVTVITLLLVRLFVGGREGALAAVRGIVRRYFPPDVVATLIADPRRTDLGGEIADVSVLFADLGGYSTYAEHRPPADVVTMLNRYFGIALPAILQEGGTPVQLAGDAIVAVFGAPRSQPDHASRACRSALAILARTDALAEMDPPGPRFHIGVNSGPAVVGNIGSDEYRNFTAIGDTTNLAARLEGLAKPGQVVV
ncbi:MAG: adenylate/guanylate cyclase domain-containing protein, partial [Candidatus Limnocylindrales bacterium]